MTKSSLLLALGGPCWITGMAAFSLARLFNFAGLVDLVRRSGVKRRAAAAALAGGASGNSRT
ncbi:hypothetical protein [Amphiplicatus metriothermophilus]|uniref:Uncharacterized protein n=1 Tax=Amphiplicatus metriothermophilus TaxID=1519374 RepID=A0A239PV19_9PROT|nr:hypothetical protein [Amphiplicatus metriothermophilus]MBB5519539.1 hypothetical protein [Amphiplicatus metriothermophilus]SNT74105.1 hypothetical protein SAMN06297382_2011 [Amphiplicatus metriothermophilus]